MLGEALTIVSWNKLCFTQYERTSSGTQRIVYIFLLIFKKKRYKNFQKRKAHDVWLIINPNSHTHTHTYCFEFVSYRVQVKAFKSVHDVTAVMCKV